ncbi:MAG: hypothetical protein AB7G28_20775 [Pirellulales bacterium]
MATTAEVVDVKFGSDRVLLYNVAPWAQMGFGVPNFGDNVGTLALPIHNLVDYIGKVQLLIMTHVDAQRTQPPSPNTLIRMMTVLNRAKAVFQSRMKSYTQQRTEPGHASPDLRAWLIHPVPYFESGFVRNHWLKEYNMLTMIALTNMLQHSDNNLALTITETFAKDIDIYFHDIRMFIGVELLGKKRSDMETDDSFDVTSDILLYKPENFTTNFEGLDTPGPVEAVPTEDDLRRFFNGIPSTIIKNYLAQYPTSGPEPGEGYAGSGFAAVHAPVGTVDGSAISKAGGTIGMPTL